MRLFLAGSVLGLGVMGLLLVSAPSREESSSAMRSGATADDDTTRAHLLVERQGEKLCIQAAFTNDTTLAGTLTYELDVQRTGSAGTSQSTQSGWLKTTPSQTDTLSTVRVNVQPGDRAELHLTIRRGETLVDEVWQRRTF